MRTTREKDERRLEHVCAHARTGTHAQPNVFEVFCQRDFDRNVVCFFTFAYKVNAYSAW